MIINRLNTKDYLEQLTGQSVDMRPIDIDLLQGLSLHLKKGYRLFKTQLLDKDLVLIMPNVMEPLKPTQAKKTLKVFSTKLNLPVVLVLDHLPTYLRNRYVSQRIPFLVPGHQLFLPQMLIDLQSFKDRETESRSYFRPATQCMIIYHLLRKSIQGLRQDEIADRLGYSAMTISRAVRECRDKGLILNGKSGVYFALHQIELWRECKSYLQSPITKTRYVDEVGKLSKFLISGFPALGHYTDLASDNNQMIALSQEQYKEMIKQDISINHRYGKIRVDVWEYDPFTITDTNFVDPLSLYLSLKDNGNDSRTSIALDQLIEYIND